MPLVSVAERLLYSTVKLTAYKSGKLISTGTGFFMNLAANGNRHIPTIITNKHVLASADQVVAMLHFADKDQPSGRFTPYNLLIAPGSYISHPDVSIDLCAILVGQILNEAISAGTPLFYFPVDFSIIPKDEDWEYLDAIEDVTMVGCPRGISDDANNLPIVRRGITATSVAKRYNGKEEFMVDMACFPGSSGSPIFIYDRRGYLDRRTNKYLVGASRLLLVGILHSGPLITNGHQVTLEQPPSVEVATMMHLGNAIRSSALRALDDQVQPLNPPLPV